MVTQIRSNTINTISDCNTKAYEALSAIFSMYADGISIREATRIGQKLDKAFKALNELGQELGELDK